jgi:hypothetical protein
MWCFWISPGHNPASTQRRGRHAPNIGLRESLEPRHSLNPPDGVYAAERTASSSRSHGPI